MRRTAEAHRVTDYSSYKHYKNRTPKKKRLSFNSWKIVIDKIFQQVSLELINRDAGVYMKGWGYFCHWMTPRKVVPRTCIKGKEVYHSNFFSNTYWYNTAFFPDVESRSYFNGWSMDKSFSEKVKDGRYEKLKQGKKYKMYYSLIFNINNI